MSSSATDVETPAKGRWLESTITTSTSDASPVKVGGPVSQLGHALTPGHATGQAEQTQAIEILRKA